MVQYNDGSDFLTMITRRSCCAWVVRVLASPSVVRLCILVEPPINKQPPQKKFENCIRKITNQQMLSYIMVVLSCCLSVSKPLLNPSAQMTKYQEASITTKECLGRSLPAVALAWNMPCKPAQQSQVCVCSWPGMLCVKIYCNMQLYNTTHLNQTHHRKNIESIKIITSSPYNMSLSC